MAPRDGDDRAVRTAGLALAVVFAVAGFVIAFGAWSVGYCGALTSDAPPPGSLRHDLCRGAGGNVMDGLVFASWLVAAAAPLLGIRWALRRGERWPLAAATTAGAVPLVVILILAEVLPQS